MTEPILKTRPASQGAFPINHKLAGLVPMAVESEQVSLTNNIKEFGQQEAIVLWKGEVVDGRCRQKALTLLKFPILYKELDETLVEADVKIFVKSINTRRNLSTTQKATVAAKDYLESIKKPSIPKQAEAWGISPSLLNNTIWLVRNYPSVVEELFKGNSVPIQDFKGHETTSYKITSIYAYYKKEKEAIKENTEHGWKDHSFIKTQAGKNWFIITKKAREAEGTVYSYGSTRDLEELANYKFNIGETQ